MIDALAASQGLAPGDPAFWMPLACMAILLLLIAAGVVLDGFDIGVGLLLQLAPSEFRPRMLALLSAWRGANELWPLLGLGLFCAAFPLAWGPMLGRLYGPMACMVLGTMLRGVSYEFRLRARAEHKPRWIRGFWFGSLLAALGQGATLGRIVTGYQTDAGYVGFAVFVGLCAVAAYALLGACWLVMRVEGELRRRAIYWARHTVRWTAVGMVAIAVTLGLANSGVFIKWNDAGHLKFTAVVWGVMLLGFVSLEVALARLSSKPDQSPGWRPFALCVLLYMLMLGGLAYSFLPYLVLDDMTLWDGAGSVASMRMTLWGVAIAAPVALVFNALAYRLVFAKAKD